MTLALALLTGTTGAASATHAPTHHRLTASHAAVKDLRHGVVDRRSATWRHQDAIERPRTRTAYAERRTHSPRYLRWLKRTWAQRAHHAWKVRLEIARREAQHPKWIALRLLGGDREQWGCLMSIVRVENAAMDPTLDFGHGHGNVHEAYGIPQANPGTKMASAGPDWRTNPETQLRWMIGYCRSRYGSVCGAAYARRTQGWY